MKVDGIFRQAVRSVAAGYFAAQDGTRDPIDIADRQRRLDPLPSFQSRLSQSQKHLVVECGVQTVILRDLTVPAHFRTHIRLVQYAGVVQALGLPVFQGAPHFDLVRTPYHLVDRTKTQPCHQLAHFLGNEAHEMDRVRRVAGKFLAQRRILRGHPHRAGVEMTDPHHDAP